MAWLYFLSDRGKRLRGEGSRALIVKERGLWVIQRGVLQVLHLWNKSSLKSKKPKAVFFYFFLSFCGMYSNCHLKIEEEGEGGKSNNIQVLSMCTYKRRGRYQTIVSGESVGLPAVSTTEKEFSCLLFFFFFFMTKGQKVT